MRNIELDRLVAASMPVDDQRVAGLALDDADVDLLEEIMSTPRALSMSSPSWIRRSSSRLVVAAIATVAIVAGLVVVPLMGDEPSSAWAAELVEVAQSAPRILVDADGWHIARADEMTPDTGEVVLVGDGAELTVYWTAAERFDALVDRLSGDWATIEENHTIAGQTATVISEDGRYTAIALLGEHAIEVRGDFASGSEFRSLIDRLVVTDVHRWLEAMPDSVVLPDDRSDAVDQMLADVPVPDGFQSAALRDGPAIRDRYQLGAEVVGAVGCSWIRQWVDARRSGDDLEAAAAVDAMRTSHSWSILLEMQAGGRYPKVFWEYADAIAGDGMVLGGRWLTVEESYAAALGCPA